MLYELGRHQFALPAQAPAVTDTAGLILWFNGRVLLNAEQQLAWPYSDLDIDPQQLEFVALLDGRPFFTGEISQLPVGAAEVTLREVAALSETWFALCARARAHLDWRDQHRFCSRCGQPVTRLAGEFAMQCTPCDLRFYPRIAPCIIVLVTDGHRVLLALGEKVKQRGWYSTLAGFIESGESAEQAVAREVKEEVGIEVANIRYLNSQAWPFPNQLMLGFHADYAGGEIVLAPEEIAEARWFDLDKLPVYPPAISISGWLIEQYRQQYCAD